MLIVLLLVYCVFTTLRLLRTQLPAQHLAQRCAECGGFDTSTPDSVLSQTGRICLLDVPHGQKELCHTQSKASILLETKSGRVSSASILIEALVFCWVAFRHSPWLNILSRKVDILSRSSHWVLEPPKSSDLVLWHWWHTLYLGNSQFLHSAVEFWHLASETPIVIKQTRKRAEDFYSAWFRPCCHTDMP